MLSNFNALSAGNWKEQTTSQTLQIDNKKMSEIDMYNSGDEAEDEEENIEMTAAEVLEKLEEVCSIAVLALDYI